MDLNLRGISGFEFLEHAAVNKVELPPAIIHTGRALTDQETLRLREFTDHIILKGARSPERLQEEVALFLQEVQTRPPVVPRAAPLPNPAIHADPVFREKTILIVDDDMRNIFALSKALRVRGLQVIMAQDGRRAIAQLEANPGIHLVIMDVMMPQMDGYTAMQTIRARPEWQTLPILALTAKAMIGEREKCLQAGASDYLSKPVDLDRLISMMRHWLTQLP
ncbi:MAG: response regulator [Magnetococcales bacterium]|nr:response regulator [Magnetococcales bacterium]